MSKHATDGAVVRGTLTDRLLQFGVPPLSVALGHPAGTEKGAMDQDGTVVSLKYLLTHENVNVRG